jgi:2-methylisocitrate lyase-like PEP mutase family enzyme
MHKVERYILGGVAALHLEDQVQTKRCGHLMGKELVDEATFVARIRAADAARKRLDDDIVIIARTDSLASLGFDEAVHRLKAAVAAGADVAFLEGMKTKDEMKKIVEVMVCVHLPWYRCRCRCGYWSWLRSWGSRVTKPLNWRFVGYTASQPTQLSLPPTHPPSLIPHPPSSILPKNLHSPPSQAPTPCFLNMVNGGLTPLISSTEAQALGYRIVIWPCFTMTTAYLAYQEAAQELKKTGMFSNKLDADGKVRGGVREVFEVCGLSECAAFDSDMGGKSYATGV